MNGGRAVAGNSKEELGAQKAEGNGDPTSASAPDDQLHAASMREVQEA